MAENLVASIYETLQLRSEKMADSFPRSLKGYIVKWFSTPCLLANQNAISNSCIYIWP